MKERRVNNNKYIMQLFLITLFWGLVSLGEIIVGVDYAKYFRLGFIIVILITELSAMKGFIFVGNKYMSVSIFLFFIVVAFSILRNVNITYIELLVIYVIVILPFFQKGLFEYRQVIRCGKILFSFCTMYGITIVLRWIVPEVFNQIYLNKFGSESYRIQNLSFTKGYNSGILSEVSTVCAYIVIGLGLSYYVIGCNKKWKKIFCIFFFLFALLLTGKRAHFIFAILAMILEYIFSAFGRTQLMRFCKVVVFGGLIAILGIGIIINSQSAILSRYATTIIALLEGEDITTGRFLIWKKTWLLIQDSFLFGAGWGSCEQFITYHMNSTVTLGAHNIWLQLWAETGIFGMLSFIFVVVCGLFCTINIIRNNNNRMVFEQYKPLVRFFLFYQWFFLLYSFTGAPLYDRVYFVPYFIGIAMCLHISTTLKSSKVMQKGDFFNEN